MLGLTILVLAYMGGGLSLGGRRPVFFGTLRPLLALIPCMPGIYYETRITAAVDRKPTI